jgi:3-(3-hydroxy-phenyl)propionate hydroxylase
VADLPVVVVGAGPTGLVAATLLAQHGVGSVVLERFPEPYPRPRAVHVDDEVLRILQQVGIAADFAEISRPAGGLRLLDARHRVIAEFRRDLVEGVHGYPQANLFDQPDLERLLRQNLARYPQVELRTGVEVIGVEPEREDEPQVLPPTRVLPVTRVRFRDSQSGHEGSIVARAVLGCDGATSSVRALIGSRLEDVRLLSQRAGRPFEERWLVVDIRTTARFPAWSGVEQVCDPRRAATFMQIGPDRYRWEFRMRPGESAAQLGDRRRLRQLIAPWLGEAVGGDVFDAFDAEPVDGEFEVRRAAEYTFRAQLADRWRQGGAFLLGDAAHLTPPFVGQGLGAGLRDAHNLAWKLARVLTRGAELRLLDSYQDERKPHARALIRLAIVAGWAMTGGQDRAATIRRLSLAAGCRIPGVTGLILKTTSPRLGAGPLVRRLSPSERVTRPDPDLAGTLCPQPWVWLGAGGEPGGAGRRHRLRLDDVLGASFALLVDGPVDAQSAALAERLDARLVQLCVSNAPARPGAPIMIEAPELRRWMAGSRVRTVLLRPDRVVLATSPSARSGRRPPDMVVEPVERTLGPAGFGPS